MKMEGNGFTGVVHMMESMVDQQRHLKAVFDLNGTRHEVCHNDWADTSMEDLVCAMRDKIAQRIATEVLGDLLRGVRWAR